MRSGLHRPALFERGFGSGRTPPDAGLLPSLFRIATAGGLRGHGSVLRVVVLMDGIAAPATAPLKSELKDFVTGFEEG
jgi:hypothetical protein